MSAIQDTSQATFEQPFDREITTPFDHDAIAREVTKLPDNPEPYVDKYFVRTDEVLKAEGLNPWARAQVFLRGGPGDLHGVHEALAIFERYTNIRALGGSIRALPEGATFSSLEPVLVIDAPIQEIEKFETIYLGVMAAATTAANMGVQNVNLESVTERCRAIKSIIGDRPLIYMGARHWRWQEDAAISAAAFRGGATDASTDNGASTVGKVGIGTIPHALETIFAWKYGRESAVVEATRAFARVIDPKVPRIALIDFNNREIDDTIATARALGSELAGVRVDTCGENIAQGALPDLAALKASEFADLPIDSADLRYWSGHGVTISGVLAIREALNAEGRSDVKIILSSGFANPKKVAAFVRAEKLLQASGLLDGPLFDALGAGAVFEPCWATTMDIVAVADERADLDDSPFSKVGRSERPSERLITYLEAA